MSRLTLTNLYSIPVVQEEGRAALGLPLQRTVIKGHQLTDPGHSRRAGWLQPSQGKVALSGLHVGCHYQGDLVANLLI